MLPLLNFMGVCPGLVSDHSSVSGSKRDTQFPRRRFEHCVRARKGDIHACYEMLLGLAGLEAVFSQFEGVIAGIDGRDGQTSIALHRPYLGLIDEHCGAGSASLHGKCGEAWNGLQIECELRLFALADANLLVR